MSGFDFNDKVEIEIFKKLINDFSVSYTEIAKRYGKKSPSFVYNIINKLGLQVPNRKKYFINTFYNKDEEDKDDQNNNNSSCTSLVPLDYSPVVRIIRYGTRNNPHIYVPELNKMVVLNSLEKVLKKQLKEELYVWECRWILKMNTDLISTEKWVDKMIYYFYNDKKENTKQYIRTQLLLDPKFKFSGLMVKEDLILDIIKIYDSDIVNRIDFNSIPDQIQSKYKSFQLKDNSGNVFLTNYNRLIESKISPFVVGKNRKTLDDLKIQSDNKFGINNFTFLSEYYGNNLDITIKCNKCGTVFITTPSTHLESNFGGCPCCSSNNLQNNRSFSKNDIQEKLNNIYGFNKYICISEYKNMKSPIKLKNSVTGEIFYKKPEDVIYHSILDPQMTKKSRGEIFVEGWLLNNNVNYISQKKVNIDSNTFNYVIIDFVVYINNTEVWIEYNGKQHYLYSSRFNNFSKEGFEKQLLRDKEIRNYCSKNNILFIEIPYLIYSYKNISILLEKTLLEGVLINNIVDFDKIYKGITKIKEVDKLNLFK